MQQALERRPNIEDRLQIESTWQQEKRDSKELLSRIEKAWGSGKDPSKQAERLTDLAKQAADRWPRYAEMARTRAAKAERKAAEKSIASLRDPDKLEALAEQVGERWGGAAREALEAAERLRLEKRQADARADLEKAASVSRIDELRKRFEEQGWSALVSEADERRSALVKRTEDEARAKLAKRIRQATTASEAGVHMEQAKRCGWPKLEREARERRATLAKKAAEEAARVRAVHSQERQQMAAAGAVRFGRGILFAIGGGIAGVVVGAVLGGGACVCSGFETDVIPGWVMGGGIAGAVIGFLGGALSDPDSGGGGGGYSGY